MPPPALTATPSSPSMLSSLAEQYHRMAAFLATQLVHRMDSGSVCMHLAADLALSCLHVHCNVGLIHMGCKVWDNALDLFDACLVVLCLASGPIAVVARKKGLLVWCLLLEGKKPPPPILC
jgi:hypothetical protein